MSHSEEDQSIERLKNFMRTLLHAGCVPEFIMEQGFNYAILIQREEEIFGETTRAAMSGTQYEETIDVCTTWMEQAALWLVEVTRDTD